MFTDAQFAARSAALSPCTEPKRAPTGGKNKNAARELLFYRTCATLIPLRCVEFKHGARWYSIGAMGYKTPIFSSTDLGLCDRKSSIKIDSRSQLLQAIEIHQNHQGIPKESLEKLGIGSPKIWNGLAKSLGVLAVSRSGFGPTLPFAGEVDDERLVEGLTGPLH